MLKRQAPLKMWKFLRSFDLAIFLMGGVVLISLIYALGQDYSRWFGGVLYSIIGLLVINLIVCSVNKVVLLCRNKVHRRVRDWGFLLFHLSLVFIFIGGLYGRLTKLEGYIELGEGQEVIEGHNSYITLREGLLFNERHGGFTVRLDRVNAFTDYRERTKDYISHVTLLNNGNVELKASIKANKPVSCNGFIIYQSKNFGNALLFKFTDKTGRENTGYVNLSLPDKKEGEEAVTDFTLPGTDTKVVVTLQKMNPVEERFSDESGSQSKGNFLMLSVQKDNKETLKEKILPGESLNIDSGILSFLDIKRWSGLIVVKNSSIYPVFIGFVTGITGLILMYR